MFDKAKWIMGNYEDRDGSYLFRKEFTVASGSGRKMRSAQLYICALGLGVCTINGRRVCDEALSTPFTRYDKRYIYRSFEVTSLLNVGRNAVGVHVGNGFYNNNMTTWNDSTQTWRDCPKLLFCLSVSYTDGTTGMIFSDKTWKVTSGPCVYNMMRQGEIYDARRMPHGFDKAGFSDAEWEYVKLAQEPGGIGELMDMPPIRVCEVIRPISCKNNIYDFGVNISGRARIVLQGKVGQKVTLSYDEAVNEDGTLRGHIDQFIDQEGKTLRNTDIFICSGGKEEYAPEFCYHGFRYVKVTDPPADFVITAEFIHTDLEQVGEFVCDNEMLNKIHEASVRSTLANYVGIPTDCPHREQNGWTGDALLSCEQSLMNFDMTKSYRKWLNDFKDVQRPSGLIPGIIPTSSWGWGVGPAWDSALILIPWYVYRNTGDTSLIRSMWENMKLYMGYLQRMAEDYIIEFGHGDWCGVQGSFACPAAVTNTSFFYRDSLVMKEAAEIMGEEDESSSWLELADEIKAAWRRRFLNDKTLKVSQTYYACAIYQGLLNDDETAAAAAELAELVKNNDYHIDCGIIGTKFIFTALSENGYADVVYRMVTNPSYPSYAYWINSGMTTLCETWSMNCSLDHHMFSEVDNWLYKYVGGINISPQGIVIAPAFLDEVSNFKAVHRGISVERAGNKLKLVLPDSAVLKINKENIPLKKGKYEFAV